MATAKPGNAGFDVRQARRHDALPPDRRPRPKPDPQPAPPPPIELPPHPEPIPTPETPAAR